MKRKMSSAFQGRSGSGLNCDQVMRQGYFKIKGWFIITLSNLLVVSLLGLTLRACHCFDIHKIKYGNLLHAHSHFAFSAWGFMALFIALCSAFLPEKFHSEKIYSRIFYASFIISWGMLVSFFIQGYGIVSIAFSVLYIVVSYWFALHFYSELKKMEQTVSIKFAKASLFFLVISTIGPLAMGPIMTKGINDTVLEMNLVYYYLHFQYNGWFIFGLLAVFFKWLENNRIFYSQSEAKLFFRLMFWGCIPCYLLSVLWSKPVGIIYIIAGSAALIHLLALIPLCHILKREKCAASDILNNNVRKLGAVVFAAFSLKMILQFLSAFPLMVGWTVKFRILVIGYLHLVLLGIVTLSLLSFFIQEKISALNKATLSGLRIFFSGFLITEVLLFSESLLNIDAAYIPYFNLWMFYSTILLPLGAMLILVGNLSDIYFSNKRYGYNNS
jgi:hypothetical protein